MYKKTVTYEDFNGEQVTEDLYFNLTQAELIKANRRYEGGMRKHLEELRSKLESGTIDSDSIMEFYNDMVELSYGQRSENGKHFYKSDDILRDFEASAAYDAFYMSLISSVNDQTAFVQGILPVSLRNAVEKARKEPVIVGAAQ